MKLELRCLFRMFSTAYGDGLKLSNLLLERFLLTKLTSCTSNSFSTCFLSFFAVFKPFVPQISSVLTLIASMSLTLVKNLLSSVFYSLLLGKLIGIPSKVVTDRLTLTVCLTLLSWTTALSEGCKSVISSISLSNSLFPSSFRLLSYSSYLSLMPYSLVPSLRLLPCLFNEFVDY